MIKQFFNRVFKRVPPLTDAERFVLFALEVRLFQERISQLKQGVIYTCQFKGPLNPSANIVVKPCDWDRIQPHTH